LLHRGVSRSVGSSAQVPAAHAPIDAYATYLARERGLSGTTIARYVWIIHQFLKGDPGGPSGIADRLGPARIEAFVASERRRTSTRTAQTTTTALRSFLRFMFLSRQTPLDLSACVPRVPAWRQTTLPRYLAPDQVERLLRSCDRTTPIGRRDFAILLLLARLGLRGNEAAALRLDDIDWRAGELIVRGKGKLHDRLPLPHDVGEALAAYLHGYRQSSSRQVFVRARAPRTGFKDPDAINEILHRAMGRAALQMPAKGIGSHLLRHSLATGMLRRGASLSEIGGVLRHRSINTTTIYAKVDVEGLRSIARPWPLEVAP
jgi:site-specific recombinase XerD